MDGRLGKETLIKMTYKYNLPNISNGADDALVGVAGTVTPLIWPVHVPLKNILRPFTLSHSHCTRNTTVAWRSACIAMQNQSGQRKSQQDMEPFAQRAEGMS